MHDLDDHPFSPASVAAESGAIDTSERAWMRWIDTAEKLIGHDMDGHDPGLSSGCGYSLDESYEKFRQGLSAEEWVALVRGRDRYVGAWDGVRPETGDAHGGPRIS
jgi:hypothetical protein